MELQKLKTTYCEIKEAEALLEGKSLDVAYIVVGDGNGEIPIITKDMKSLVNQRLKLNVTVDDSQKPKYKFIANIPENAEEFAIRELGIIDTDEKLLYVAQMDGTSTNLLSNGISKQLRLQMIFTPADGVNVVVIDPSVTNASVDYCNDNFQKLSEKAQANGYAPLDENAKIPEVHLPVMDLGANTELNNLSLAGNSRLQFNPFAINNGSVNDNGKNVTISFPKIAETITYDYPNYRPIQNIDNTGVKSTAISGLGDTSQAYRMLNPQSFQFYNDVVVTEHEFPYPIEFASVTTSVSTGWGMRQIKISAWNTTTNQYDVILNTAQGAVTATHAMTQVVRAKKFKFEFQGGRFAPNKVYYNCLTDITFTGTVYQSTQKGSSLICAPCTITTADGRTKKFTSQIGYGIPDNLADGTYRVLKSIADGSLSLVTNLTISNISPLEPNSNDYWLDTSQAPLCFKKYLNSNWVEDNDNVYIADVTVSEFFFTAVENVAFNKEYGKVQIIKTYKNGASGYRIYSDGYCEQWGVVPYGTDVDYTGTLLKSYSNTNYQIGFTTLAKNTSKIASQWIFLAIYPLTNSTFGCKAINFERSWRAYGYLAEGEY